MIHVIHVKCGRGDEDTDDESEDDAVEKFAFSTWRHFVAAADAAVVVYS